MRYVLTFLALMLCGCASEVRQQDSSQEKTVERETATVITKGTQAGQPVDVVVKTVIDKVKMTDREASLSKESTSTPNVPTGDIFNILTSALTGNWTGVIASLVGLLIGKVVGRRGAESQLQEVTEGVANFVKDDPSAGQKLSTHLSMAMSKSTKQTVRRIKP